MGGDIKKVAIHEAAHSVAAYILGGQVGGIQLDGRESGTDMSWQGNSSNNTKGLSPEQVAILAFAGPLAEAKHLACRSLPNESDAATATLNSKCLPEILEALRHAGQFVNPERMDAIVGIEGPGGSIKQKVFFGDSCSDTHMALIVREKVQRGTRYGIRYWDADGKRQRIRFAKLNKKAVETIDRNVQQILAAQQVGNPLPPTVAEWVDKLSPYVADRLANAGLIPKRESALLEDFLTGYIDSRSAAKSSNTIRNWNVTKQKLTDFFGTDTNLRDISEGDAEDWFHSLSVEKGLADATVAQAVKHAKQFLAYATKKRLVFGNPFGVLKAPSDANPKRQSFIDRTIIGKVIEAAPDWQWRTIIALCRYGGLRCPSEVLSLRWIDIDWEHERFTVRQHKTSERVVPLFPDLRPYLDEAQELADEEAEFVITRYRDSQTTNLRTTFEKIIRRAGVKQWPRLFQNLRSTRETELEEHFPTHVVCEWIGNSPAVSHRHYLQVTDDHFRRAGEAFQVDHQVDQQPPAAFKNQSQIAAARTEENPENACFSVFYPSSEVPRRGVEPLLPD